MVDKIFVTAQSLLSDSFRLGLRIMDDGFHPDYIIGIWRGGTPVGIAVQELLKYHGFPPSRKSGAIVHASQTEGRHG